MHFAANIQFLRKKNGFSQQEVAEKLGVSRTTLGDYERAHTEPDLRLLHKIAVMYGVPIDDLLNSKLFTGDLDAFHYKGMKILSLTTDKEGINNIECVQSKAYAGYLSQFQEPEFIKDLPKISIPQLKQGKYRAFEISGDSMLPMAPGSIVICSYVEQLDDLQNNECYVVVSKNDGIVYKRLQKSNRNNEYILQSDNPTYENYILSATDISEIWHYKAHVSFQDPMKQPQTDISVKLADLQSQLSRIQKSVENK